MEILMIYVAPISTRNQFGWLLTRVGLTGKAVEVGTHRGAFTQSLLETWQGLLTCIDPWSIPSGYEEAAKLLPDRGDTREDDYRVAIHLIEPYKDRVSIMRTLSHMALGAFKDNSLDFVYIDGDHSLESVRTDIHRWWSKVRAGGILAGHDFICPGETDGGWGRNIQAVVLPFCNEYLRDLYLVVEENGLPWSFYIVK